MEKYIDIHAHILSGIDDGAEDILTSIQMLRIAAENHISQIILTSHNKPMHHNANPEKIRLMTESLMKKAKLEGLDIQLYTGNELYYRSGLTQELLEGKVLTLAGSDYVLVEFNPMDDYDYIRNGIYSLIAGGYHPILAHVERYSRLNGRTERVEDLYEMGCYMQVNAGSVMGEYGFGTRLFVRSLLKEQMVHFVATDAHDTGKRAPRLKECADFIERKYGEEYRRRLLYINPMHVIRNEYL